MYIPSLKGTRALFQALGCRMYASALPLSARAPSFSPRMSDVRFSPSPFRTRALFQPPSLG